MESWQRYNVVKDLIKSEIFTSSASKWTFNVYSGGTVTDFAFTKIKCCQSN